MSAPCDSFRDAFLGAAPAERPRDHRAACASCEGWAHRVELRERALEGLERLADPPELDGAVVAALEAGFRQDRAVEALRGLGRVRSPRALDQALTGELASRETAPDDEVLGLPSSLPAARRLRAPAELAGRVADELADPAAQRARRFVGSLPRLAAPAELDARLAAEDWSRAARRRPSATLVGALGVLALAVVALGAMLRSPRSSEPRYDFVVEVVDDPSQLSSMAVGLLNGVSGGVVTAGRL